MNIFIIFDFSYKYTGNLNRLTSKTYVIKYMSEHFSILDVDFVYNTRVL